MVGQGLACHNGVAMSGSDCHIGSDWSETARQGSSYWRGTARIGWARLGWSYWIGLVRMVGVRSVILAGDGLVGRGHGVSYWHGLICDGMVSHIGTARKGQFGVDSACRSGPRREGLARYVIMVRPGGARAGQSYWLGQGWTGVTRNVILAGIGRVWPG
jgi:hypothetical protein